MKNIIILILFISSISIFAQSKWVAGASFNVGFPTGSFSDLAKTGIGGSAIGEFAFSEKVSATLSASYQNFPGNSEGIAYQGKVINFSVNSIPVMAGIRYYFSNEFFGMLETGVHFFRASADVSDLYSSEKISTEYEAKFGGAFGLGYRFTLSEQSAMEIDGVYQIIQDDLNSVSLRLGIMIFLDKI